MPLVYAQSTIRGGEIHAVHGVYYLVPNPADDPSAGFAVSGVLTHTGRMRYLGIDYGGKRIGLALSDEGGVFAFPHATIPNNEKVVQMLAALIAEKHVGAIAMGDTHATHDQPNDVTAEARAFAEVVERETGLSVTMVPEAWSTREAGRFAPVGKEHDDSAAAAVILQRYLDSLAHTGDSAQEEEI